MSAQADFASFHRLLDHENQNAGAAFRPVGAAAAVDADHRFAFIPATVGGLANTFTAATTTVPTLNLKCGNSALAGGRFLFGDG
jgi:hypothetical protein